MLKQAVPLLALVVLSSAFQTEVVHSSYGYLHNYGIPAALNIREAEESHSETEKKYSRIIGGVPAAAGQYPWQAGLLTDVIGEEYVAACGASLISNSRLVTAAHCWYDGVDQGWRITVVLGSVLLFSGGTRLQTSVVAVHPDWLPILPRNDVAVIYFPTPVAYSPVIAPIPLPASDDINDNFAGQSAIAIVFGATANEVGIRPDQSLNHVRVKVISNSICYLAFPLILQPSHICTSGVGTRGVCGGDSGGPLVVTRNGMNVLIGITSFISAFGCQSGLPSVFTRVTSHISFINQHI